MNKAETKNILVYIEVADAAPVKVSLESLAQAKRMADEKGEKVIAAVIGQNIGDAAKEAAAAGADKVITVDDAAFADFNLDVTADVMMQIIEKEKPEAVFVGGTQDGKDLAPKLGAKCATGCASDVVGMKLDEQGNIDFTCPLYSGTVLEDVVIAEARPQIATLRSGAFKKLEEAGQGEVVAESFTVADDAVKAKITETVKELTESVNLEDAEIIVSGGRGMGSADNFKLVQELADLLGGVVGATRPAIEDGWVPRNHQVGQSGKIVAPKLYIACGISGATQHLSGITGSDYIVAINKDEDAPIFSVANIGIVGNALKVLPVMIEEVKKIQAQ
jgi:electron transfer flavoprotein alpha subunit